MINRYILILDWNGAVTPFPETGSATPEQAEDKRPQGNHIGRWFVYDRLKKSRVKRCFLN